MELIADSLIIDVFGTERLSRSGYIGKSELLASVEVAPPAFVASPPLAFVASSPSSLPCGGCPRHTFLVQKDFQDRDRLANPSY